MKRDAMTPKRAARLYRMLVAVSAKLQTRSALMKRCRSGLRTFYRDLDALEACGIRVETNGGGHQLVGATLEEAVAKLPFPATGLTFGDVRGGDAKKKLEGQLKKITGRIP